MGQDPNAGIVHNREVDTKPARLVSIDAYRGFVMFLMMAEMLHLASMQKMNFETGFFKYLQDVGFFRALAFHTSHVEWFGCSLHDMIQPSFTFLVGVSLPFSLAARDRKGESKFFSSLHAIWRGAFLAMLGIFLRSLDSKYTQTNFTFDDTLTQIGFGYAFLFFIAQGPRWVSWGSLAMVLVGYWIAFAMYSFPGTSESIVGVPADWAYHSTGFASHWNKNMNLASSFDLWFMNLFPRSSPYLGSGGGYCTLSFIPTLGTMILGLIAGRWLQESLSFQTKATRFLLASIACMAIAWGLDWLGICPIVKRIWTPTWTLWSGGICFAILFGFHAICDVANWKWWTFPLVVIGSNSIAAYVMDWTIQSWVRDNLTKHLGGKVFDFSGNGAMLLNAMTFAVLWLILLWMYRRKIFIKV